MCKVWATGKNLTSSLPRRLGQCEQIWKVYVSDGAALARQRVLEAAQASCWCQEWVWKQP